MSGFQLRSERQVQKLDFKTGLVIEHRSSTSAEGLEQRLAGMQAELSEHSDGEVLERFAWIVCDGCGRRLQIEELALPAGWVSDKRGESCPECS